MLLFAACFGSKHLRQGSVASNRLHISLVSAARRAGRCPPYLLAPGEYPFPEARSLLTVPSLCMMEPDCSGYVSLDE